MNIHISPTFRDNIFDSDKVEQNGQGRENVHGASALSSRI